MRRAAGSTLAPICAGEAEKKGVPPFLRRLLFLALAGAGRNLGSSAAFKSAEFVRLRTEVSR